MTIQVCRYTVVYSLPAFLSSVISRKIIHCDCDCFYASVEIRDDPSLRGKPIAVGGSSERGVLTTCSYEARAFGVRSAMPTGQALRLCPDLIVLPVSMDKYKEASRQIRTIFAEYTDLIEPLSLDEAFLDVSDTPHFHGSATRIAEAIRRAVASTVGITISAGVAPNKFLAKIASDWQKPDGLTVIRPTDVDDFIRELKVEKLFGVGQVTAEKMHRAGIKTCADLQEMSLLELDRKFGSFGARLFDLCRGQDDRPVRNSRERKSLSVERTFRNDLKSVGECEARMIELLEELQRRLAAQSVRAPIQKLFVKMRFSDFSRTTAEASAEQLDQNLAQKLVNIAWERNALDVRLLGVGVRFRPDRYEQLELF